MDADELDIRARTFDGWVPPDPVDWLLRHGHQDEAKLQARGGDWISARAWARLLADQGRRAEALEALMPYGTRPDGGSRYTARHLAELLSGAGDPEAAVAHLDPDAPAEASSCATGKRHCVESRLRPAHRVAGRARTLVG
ncbi:hypothetical protein OG539_19475 [Actinacidiphila glaucinigra]|uniref:hypothetical protein n=1 Tax=Actinacidiphila glaucinigra TaxID=235986 RepID=UPI002DDA9AD6|nr:hypothetical protein [Actinacidiphila glaucinigra]WSD61622.1 hypothetical protein OIE69_23315 [Actinacidiphila glaucinigra]